MSRVLAFLRHALVSLILADAPEKRAVYRRYTVVRRRHG